MSTASNTHALVAALADISPNIAAVSAQLRDGTAPAEASRALAQTMTDLANWLASHADDVSAGIVADQPLPHNALFEDEIMAQPPIRRPAAVAVSASLRDLREQRNIGVRAFARQIGVHPGQLSGWELGNNVPPATTVARILGFHRIAAAESERILKLVDLAANANIVDKSDSRIVNLMWAYEEQSSQVVEWAPTYIPELLRTADSAARMCENSLATLEHRDLATFHHNVRQQALKEGARRYVFLIGDQVLDPLRGGEHEQQVQHLRAMAQLPFVTIQFVPSPISSQLPAPGFTVFEDLSKPIAVALKHIHCASYLTEEKLRKEYHATARTLQRRAFSASETCDMLNKLPQVWARS
ncbi:Scr1 family TA system antitoxin-like transcriptional regulator [Amycolatopsis sp. lyj-346]|uniref:Scr1 family TA system antitoxin-like transcriptional regulator n=1 Tax=Amycolatopsis sp. lyj-346 TaxID=2789289 RepID=UPI00397E8D08